MYLIKKTYRTLLGNYKPNPAGRGKYVGIASRMGPNNYVENVEDNNQAIYN